MKSLPRTWDINRLSSALDSATTWADVCRNLGISVRGSTYATLEKHAKRLNLDTSHLVKYYSLRTLPLEQIFIEESEATRQLVRKYFKQIVPPDICAICNMKNEWLGTKLVLQLDHINGKTRDNRIENLRWLCPNCHSQTETYGSKNRKHYGTKQVSFCSCGNKKTWRAIRCKVCHDKMPKLHLRMVKRPSKNELENLLKDNSRVAIGKLYCVSDSAVRKWIKSYKI